MAGSKHDKHALILLYKLVFQDRYPADEYEITFDPNNRPISALPFLPDILITQNRSIIKWIEVGQLPYAKGVAVIEHIGQDRFLHIPYTDPIFSLTYVHPLNDARIIGPEEDNLSIKRATKRVERDLIQKALDLAQGNRSQAAQLLEISRPALLDKIRKFDLDKQLTDHEAQLIKLALVNANGNRALAAKHLNITPDSLKYRLSKLKITA